MLGIPTARSTRHRWTDRWFARPGLLEDAAPLFGSATAVPRAGVLLALPARVVSGVFVCVSLHLTNVLKIVAYQAESDLLRLVAPHYRRADDEGRTLLQAALASAADREVTPTELRVTLAPRSSPHRTRVIAALCEELNHSNTIFPGNYSGRPRRLSPPQPTPAERRLGRAPLMSPPFQETNSYKSFFTIRTASGSLSATVFEFLAAAARARVVASDFGEGADGFGLFHGGSSLRDHVAGLVSARA